MTKNVVEYGGAVIDLEGFQPKPESEDATKLLLKWSQFDKVRPQAGEAPNYVKTSADADIVAVFDTRATQAAGLVHRRLVSTEVVKNRNVHTYELLGFKLVGKGQGAADQALAWTQAGRQAQLAAEAAAIPGMEALQVVPTEEPF